jgi:hypothetical protein
MHVRRTPCEALLLHMLLQPPHGATLLVLMGAVQVPPIT